MTTTKSTASKSETTSERPNPEVRLRPQRRRFTQKYKQSIVEQADRAEPGELGELLRREGLYSSHLSAWRKQQRLLAATAPGHRGRKPKVDPLAAENEELRRRLARAEERLKISEEIIAAQKKLCALLGASCETPESGGSSR